MYLFLHTHTHIYTYIYTNKNVNKNKITQFVANIQLYGNKIAGNDNATDSRASKHLPELANVLFVATPAFCLLFPRSKVAHVHRF